LNYSELPLIEARRYPSMTPKNTLVVNVDRRKLGIDRGRENIPETKLDVRQQEGEGRKKRIENSLVDQRYREKSVDRRKTK